MVKLIKNIFSLTCIQIVFLLEFVKVLSGFSSGQTMFKNIINFHQIKFTQPKTNQIICSDKCIYLCNHRSVSDGYIDGYITSDSAPLARILTIVPNPFGTILPYILNKTFIFNRNVKDRTVLQTQIKHFMKNNSIFAYPEGHRQQTDKSYPFKFGIVRMAYRLNFPVQIIMTKNKEKVLSIQLGTFGFGVSCRVTVDRVMHPCNFKNIDDWCVSIEKRWYEVWDKHLEIKSDDIDMPPPRISNVHPKLALLYSSRFMFWGGIGYYLNKKLNIFDKLI